MACVVAQEALADAQRVLTMMTSSDAVTQIELQHCGYLSRTVNAVVYSHHEQWLRRGASVRVNVHTAGEAAAAAYAKRAKHSSDE